MWDLEKLQKRRDELKAGLEQMEKQFQMAYYVQSGAISQLDEQIQEEIDARANSAGQRRETRAEKRARGRPRRAPNGFPPEPAHAHANGVPEPALNGEPA